MPLPTSSAAPTSTAGVFLDDVLRGLAACPPSLPSKYFYDARGSALFDAITALDAYYPTRTEEAIMAAHTDEIAACVGAGGGEGTVLIEYGSGSSVKTRRLLDALPALAAYVPIDISGEHLAHVAERLRAAYPRLPVLPLAADYTAPFHLPDLPLHRRRVVYFPGSTIGNYEPADARAILAQMARVAGPGGGLLIGADQRKDESVLLRAYDDEEGVTAAFNLNLLARINRELGADFDLSAWRHEARYDAAEGRIEMHLVAERAQTVRVAGRAFSFPAGQSIHTENSYKYTPDGLAALAAPAGLRRAARWTDPRGYFAV